MLKERKPFPLWRLLALSKSDPCGVESRCLPEREDDWEPSKSDPCGVESHARYNGAIGGVDSKSDPCGVERGFPRTSRSSPAPLNRTLEVLKYRPQHQAGEDHRGTLNRTSEVLKVVVAALGPCEDLPLNRTLEVLKAGDHPRRRQVHRL